MVDEKVELKSDKNNVSIFDLYSSYKIIKIEDNQGRCVTVKICTPTSYDQKLGDEKYNEIYQKEINKITEKEPEYRKKIKSSTKEEIVKEYLEYGEQIRKENKDLIDIGDEKNMTKKQKEDAYRKGLREWRKHSEKELNSMDFDTLTDTMINFLINSMAAVQASGERVIFDLVRVCRDAGTDELLFSDNPKDKNFILNINENVLKKLAFEFNSTKISQADIRRLAEDPDFLLTTQSQGISNAQ